MRNITTLSAPGITTLRSSLTSGFNQTAEDATRNTPTRAAMMDFQKSLFEFNVQCSNEYKNAPAWGRQAVTQ